MVTWAEVDLDAIAHNIAAYKRHVGARVEVFAVVKANAYGHGAAAVSRTALTAGASRLAVHRAGEGIELRKAGIDAPILVVGYTPPEGAKRIVRWHLTPSLMTLDFAQALSGAAAAAGAVVPVHVKVDTGMSRYGLMPEEVVEFMTALHRLPGIHIEGLFTHFATADSADPAITLRQLAVFNDVRAALSEVGITIPIAHAANSAAAMKLPETHLNAIRPGIAIYGMSPSAEWPPVFEIRPSLTLKSLVSRVRDIPAGTGVSYGYTFITARTTRVALIPVGYGDGYHRILSNQGSVLVRGQRAPIIGRVCMDQIVVDVTAIPGVQLGDEVVLVGAQGSQTIRAEEVARLAGTINYEVTTSLLPRVARVFLRGGRRIAVTALEGE
ncbi:MAG: alanine racemase [Anaerolineaceae bacterium]|nr:alanine racemase [Anaerolineaceae bacterium]